MHALHIDCEISQKSSIARCIWRTAKDKETRLCIPSSHARIMQSKRKNDTWRQKSP